MQGASRSSMLSAAVARALAEGWRSPGALVRDAVLPSQLRSPRAASSLHAIQAASCWGIHASWPLCAESREPGERSWHLRRGYWRALAGLEPCAVLLLAEAPLLVVARFVARLVSLEAFPDRLWRPPCAQEIRLQCCTHARARHTPQAPRSPGCPWIGSLCDESRAGTRRGFHELHPAEKRSARCCEMQHRVRGVTKEAGRLLPAGPGAAWRLTDRSTTSFLSLSRQKKRARH